MLKTTISFFFSVFLLIPTALFFWNLAVLTTIASSAILTFRSLVVYSGLALALLRRGLEVIPFPRGSYPTSNSDSQLGPKVKATCRPTNPSLRPRNTSSPWRSSGKRRRVRTPSGPKRVDYTTLLRPPKRQDSAGDYFGMWETVVGKAG